MGDAKEPRESQEQGRRRFAARLRQERLVEETVPY